MTGPSSQIDSNTDPPPRGQAEQLALAEFTDWRAREAVRREDGWVTLQWGREQREGAEVFGFVIECQRGDGTCDSGDQMFGFVAGDGVCIEQSN